MARLIAEKSHSYGTRRLKAGDEYEASELDARVLVAVLLARLAPDNPSLASSERSDMSRQSEATAEDGTDVLERLRTEAESLGIRIDRRWGPVRLNYEIKLARS